MQLLFQLRTADASRDSGRPQMSVTSWADYPARSPVWFSHGHPDRQPHTERVCEQRENGRESKLGANLNLKPCPGFGERSDNDVQPMSCPVLWGNCTALKAAADTLYSKDSLARAVHCPRKSVGQSSYRPLRLNKWPAKKGF
jgi:hypothetical protein